MSYFPYRGLCSECEGWLNTNWLRERESSVEHFLHISCSGNLTKPFPHVLYLSILIPPSVIHSFICLHSISLFYTLSSFYSLFSSNALLLITICPPEILSVIKEGWIIIFYHNFFFFFFCSICQSVHSVSRRQIMWGTCWSLSYHRNCGVNMSL